MNCKKCGKENNPGAKFCSYCGYKFEEPELETPEQEEEPKEKNRPDFQIESFNWNLEGFPSADSGKTDDIDFNWDSVLEKKKADIGYNDPISFNQKRPEPVKKEEPAEAEEKYTLEELFRDEENNSPDKTEIVHLNRSSEKNDDVVELSFEDDLFAVEGTEKPKDATIRINQTIHFTNQLYSFDNKQAEYQSVLDEEYDNLSKGENIEEEFPEEEVKTIPAEEEKIPEIVTGIDADDFLRELYGTDSEEDDEEEILDEEEAAEAADELEEDEDTEEPAEEAEEEENTEETEEPEPEAKEEPEQEPAEEPAEPEEEEPAEEPVAEAAEPVAEEPAEEETPAEAEPVKEEKTELVGISLARTPRGVLIIEKNSKDKLTRRTLSPSRSSDENEEAEGKGTEEMSSEKPEKEGNEKLSFGDVFNDTDDNNNSEKPAKKGKALKVVAVIVCILIVLELATIGIQYFAPDSAAAKEINKVYNQVISKIIPEENGNGKISEDDLIVTSPLDAYATAKKGTYSQIAELVTDIDLKFSDNKDYEFEGYGKAGTFEDKEWYTDDEGKKVMYGDAIVTGAADFYASLVDYKNGKSEEVFNKITAESPLYSEIAEYEIKEEAVSAINLLTFGEVKTSEDGIYLMTSVEYTDQDSGEVTVETNAVMLKPENQEMKVDSIIKL